MITRDGLRSGGRVVLGSALTALLGVLLVLACSRQSETAEIVGPEQPMPEEVGGGPLSLANLTLPFAGTVNSQQKAFKITQTGTGGAGSFISNNTTTHVPALDVAGAGTGPAINVVGGKGIGGLFVLNGSSNASPVLDVIHYGPGTGVDVLTQGGGSAGVFRINNTATFANALEGITNGRNAAVYGATGGIGIAGRFVNTSNSNSSPAIEAVTNGTGSVLRVDHYGSSGNLALFRVNGNNRIRFNRDGKGFFNGGTQTGGADVAEAFAVEGPVARYEPGDVLVVSRRSDRTVEKTAEPYSTRVIGVYATKPGVLLTERGIDDGLEGLVPVGVIGVIPTKVSTENGPIRRGDLLVTASRPGHAMRATPVVIQGVTLYPTGAILGRAMQEFRGPGTGVITAFVNVK